MATVTVRFQTPPKQYKCKCGKEFKSLKGYSGHKCKEERT